MPVRTLPHPSPHPSPRPRTIGIGERKIVDAALACIARVGVSKTTVDDVAAEAGCSRATLYRIVRSKRQLLEKTIDAEISRLLAAIDAEVETAGSLEDVLVAMVVVTAREIDEHPALRFVIDHEPELVSRHLAFAPGSAFLNVAAGLVAPRLERYLPPQLAARTAEWMCRIVLSYSCNPSPALLITDSDDVRRLVHDFVLPGAGVPTT